MVKSQSSSDPRDPVIVAGVRTPFMRSHKAFVDMASYDLGRHALSGLIKKTGIDPNEVEHVSMGTVIHDPLTSNVARESVLAAGFPATVPANTVSLACISSNVAATQVADMIKLKHIDVGIFGGMDTCSDPPIRLSRQLRKTLVKFEKVKSPKDILAQWPILKKIRFKDLAPDVPKVTEFSNGKSMGEGAEILAMQAGVTREESDVFAERSHQLAVRAQKDGVFDEDIVHVPIPPKWEAIYKDDGPREDTTIEKLAKLNPAFDKKFGVNTAGSSSFLTDGASAVLMMSRERAGSFGLSPLAVLRDYVFRAGDALTEMLSGPALTIPWLLKRNGLKVEDIGVWEIHEAFAAQVLANLKLLKRKDFLKQRLNLEDALGDIPIEKINVWGGSLSIGHPFGATGGRLINTAARRLKKEQQRFAVVSGCAAGGHGSAVLLENIDS